MPSPTPETRILISFGARRGGFEFAMALRHEIYAHYGIRADGAPYFCYIDAESLRGDPGTSYNRDDTLDTNFMRNPEWESHYELAMTNCGTMIILLTSEWLRSPWCWHELTMLQRIAATRGMKVVLVVWPDARVMLDGGSFVDRDGHPRSKAELMGAYESLPGGRALVEVSGEATPPGPALIERTGGVNEFSYACTEAETQRIVHEVRI